MRPIRYLFLTLCILVGITILGLVNNVSPRIITAYSTAFVALGTLSTVFAVLYQIYLHHEEKKSYHLKNQLIPDTLNPIQESLQEYIRILKGKPIIDLSLEPVFRGEKIPGTATHNMAMRLSYDDVKKHHYKNFIKKWESFWVSYQQLCDESEKVISLFQKELDLKIESIKREAAQISGISVDQLDPHYLENSRMDLLAGCIFSFLWEGRPPMLEIEATSPAGGILVRQDIPQGFINGMMQAVLQVRKYATAMFERPSSEIDSVKKKRDCLAQVAEDLMIELQEIISYKPLRGNCSVTSWW